MLLDGQRRHAGGDAAVERQTGTRDAAAWRPDSSRRMPRAMPGSSSDAPLARQRAQLLVDALAVAQAQRQRELGAGGRHAMALEVALDQLQDLPLPGA